MWYEKFKRWLKRIRRWLLRRQQQRSSSPEILRRWYGKWCAIFQIRRETEGEIATIRIACFTAPDYLLTLDDLSEVETEIFGQFNGATIRLKPFSYTLPSHTHRFAVFRVWADGDCSPIGIWDTNLEYTGASAALNKIAPRRAVAAIAFHTMKLRARREEQWRAQIEALNWTELLQDKLAKELNNPYHRINAKIIYLHKKSF